MIVPISAVVPTRDRALVLQRALNTLRAQGVLPAELIVVDGSTSGDSRTVVENWGSRVAPHCKVVWEAANDLGAAIQRNQGVTVATKPFILFFDDDILFEPECLSCLWRGLQSDLKLGGVSAMIVNQHYHPPGLPSRVMFRLMHGRSEKSFAGRVIGPAINLLPEDGDDLPDVVPVEWLNLGCTLYRREALPSRPFDASFTGYSMMEDLALSLTVGKKWKLGNVRTARIYHDSQLAEYKNDKFTMAKMELINRHHVMTEILERRQGSFYLKLLLFEVFCLTTSLLSFRAWAELPQVALGKMVAAATIVMEKQKHRSRQRVPGS